MDKVATIEELRALDKSATPAPWYANEICTATDGDGCHSDNDALLAAAARNALPHLLAIAEAARKYNWADDEARLGLVVAVNAARAAGLFGKEAGG